MPVVEEICTVTSKGQTTVPKAVRQALGVSGGGRIAFRVEDEAVTVRAWQEEDDSDPALRPFLALLEADLVRRPQDVVDIPPDLAEKWDALAASIGRVDPDAPIEGDLAL